MIFDLFIITEGGISIYHKSFTGTQIDEQLLSGFLTAISDFSKETMGEKIKKIDVQTNQLVIHFDRTLNVTIAALASQKDSITLLKRLLLEISEAFYLEFRDYLLKDHGHIDISKIGERFDPILERKLERKIMSRGLKHDILGMVAGIFVLGVFSFLLSFYFRAPVEFYFIFRASGSPFQNVFDFILITFRLQFMLLLELIPAALILGYISGSTQRGHTIYMTILLLVFFLGIQIPYFFFVNFLEGFQLGSLSIGSLIETLAIFCYLPFYFVTAFFFIHYGGHLMERKYLYPLPH